MKRKKEPPKRAIALYYDGKDAPRITAKGEGAVAEEILRLAREYDVPLQEDRELAALLSKLDLGDEIPQPLYVAVAEVLAFAYMVMGRFPGDAGRPHERKAKD